MKWVQRWENWLMTPFSTDSVSLGRPAICGASGARLGQGCHTSRVSWGASYSQLHAWLSLPSPYGSPVEVGAGDSGHRCEPTGPPTLSCSSAGSRHPPSLASLPSCLRSPPSVRPSPQSPQAISILAYALPWPLPKASGFSARANFTCPLGSSSNLTFLGKTFLTSPWMLLSSPSPL